MVQITMVTLKRPTKSPPPPPRPPPNLPPAPHHRRKISPARSSRSLTNRNWVPYGGSRSEYAESVISSPPNLSQITIPTEFPSSSRSEYAYGSDRGFQRPFYHCQTPPTERSQRSFSRPLDQIDAQQSSAHADCPRSSVHSSQSTLSIDSQPPVPKPPKEPPPRPLSAKPLLTSPLTIKALTWVPPTPKARVARPRLSISPQPTLMHKKETSTKLYDKCKASNYRRLIEHHVVKVFNYLKCREERRQICEREISHKFGISDRTISTDSVNTIRSIYNVKETHYLRSLRVRMSPTDFEVIQSLGKGFIGHVFLVRKKSGDKGGPELYAMKKLMKSQVFQQNHWAHVTAERDILAEADSEWIVKLYSSFQDDHHLYFILEYVPGGDLMNLLYDMNVFPDSWASFYIAEISLALQFVHDKGFVHRDIKPDNILIDAQGHIKLTDFGLCTGFRWTHDARYYRDDTLHPGQQNENLNNNNFIDHPTITKALTKREIEHSLRKKALSLVGSPNYIAPEVLRQAFGHQESANEKLCDWWSVGVILYEMVIGYCPFIDLEKLKDRTYSPLSDRPEQIQTRILNWRHHLAFPSPNDPDGPPFMQDKFKREHYIKPDTRNFIQGLLCDPSDRLCQNGVNDIKGHPFFKNINWSELRSCKPPFVPELSNELDTRHFAHDMHANAPEKTIESNISIKMPLNDFTYKSFWQK